MKKIKIIRRNFVLSIIMFAQYAVLMHFVWPQFMTALRTHSVDPLGWTLATALIVSGVIAGSGYGLFIDTCKMYRQHRLWKAGLLTAY